MATARDSSVDVARGIAIVLVVAGHSLRGLIAGGVVSGPAVRWLDTWLYVTHLPVFAFAVGLLTPASVLKVGTRRYLARRLGLLAWLYGVWTLLQGTVEVLTSPWKNRAVTWRDVMTVWIPVGPLWFLPHLAVATLVMLIGAPWRRGLVRVTGVAAVVAGVALLSWGWDPGVAGLGGLALLPAYLAGAGVGLPRFQRLAASVPGAVLALVGVLGTIAVGLIVVFLPVTPPTTQSVRSVLSVALAVPVVCLAVVAMLALAVAWSRAAGSSGWMAYVGRQSLPVYLAHIVVTAGVRVLLVRLGVTNLWLHLAVATVLGVALPLVLERVTRPVPYLFVPPWQVRRQARSD